MLAKKRALLLLFISFLALGAAADDGDQDSNKRVWACKANGTTEEDLYLVSWGNNSYVKLYEARIWGNHYSEGDDLRWDFGDVRNRHTEYSVILKPDGSLDYYDFRNTQIGEEIEASYYYNCRLAQS